MSGGRLMPFSGGSGVGGAGTPRTVGGVARGSTHGVAANTRASAHPTTSGRQKIHCRLVTIYACVILTYSHSGSGDSRGDRRLENDLIWFLTAERHSFIGGLSALSNQSNVPKCTYHLPFIKSSRWATCISVCISVCLSVQPTNGALAIGFRTQATMANKWIARAPRFSAHSDHKHSKDLHAHPDQIHPSGMAAIRSRTRATLANKWIARRRRSDHKHSKDLPARPDQIHPDPRAAQRKAAEMNACVTVI